MGGGGLSQNERKMRQEASDFELFRFLLPDVPTGPFEQPEPPAPDILLPISGRTLGVELTSFALDSGSAGGSAARARDALKAEILSATKVLWNSLNLPPVFVNVTWQERSELVPGLLEELPENLVMAVENQLPANGTSTSIEYPVVGWRRLLQLGVGRVSISRVRGLQESDWVSTYGGSVPSLTSAEPEVRRLIQEKEPNIRGYRLSCDEIWLLIVARGGNIEAELCLDDVPVCPQFESSCDRVFLLSRGWRQVLELAIKDPQ